MELTMVICTVEMVWLFCMLLTKIAMKAFNEMTSAHADKKLPLPIQVASVHKACIYAKLSTAPTNLKTS